MVGILLGGTPGVRLEAGVAAPLSAQQSALFGVGGTGRVTGFYEFVGALDVEAAFDAVVLTPSKDSPTGRSGSALGLAAGLRLKRPLRGTVLTPSVSFDLGWQFSGVSTIALIPTAALQWRPDEKSAFSFGVFARVTALLPLATLAGREATNATIFMAGLSIQFEPVPEEKEEPIEPGPTPPPLPATTSDSDKDGVSDDVDACRDAAGPVATKGCPDTDGDGVPDVTDRCPKAVGTVKDGGCPVYREVVITERKIEIRQKLFFAYGTTTILPKSFQLLEEVVRALNDHSALCVRVEGHTDSTGNADVNLELSGGRAASVRSYLVEHGVDAKRVSSVGYGSTLPLDNNKTPEGRENNRRVEFSIVQCPR